MKDVLYHSEEGNVLVNVYKRVKPRCLRIMLWQHNKNIYEKDTRNELHTTDYRTIE